MVESLTVLDGTIFLLLSPLLWYGTKELLEKLGANCIITAFEGDDQLFDLTESSLKEQDFCPNIHLYSRHTLSDFDAFLRDAVKGGKYRRIIPLDFSAGKSFSIELCDKVSHGAEEIVERFWKNRITLQKFGKLYSKNIFLNLPKLASSPQLNQMKGSVAKPIIVFGAGESIDEIFESPESKEIIRHLNTHFFVIAVDAAITSLAARGLHIDAAVVMEGQFVITKAFIGMQEQIPLLFQDMCARSDIAPAMNATSGLYLTEFTDANFIKDLTQKGICTCLMKPLGSVGLAAVEIALTLRKADSVSVFITGLDFCWSLGKTHAKWTPAHRNMLSKQTRFAGVENIGASFDGALDLVSKDGRRVFSNPAMVNYSSMFSEMCRGKTKVFDLAKTGLPNGLPFLESKKLLECTESSVETSDNKFTFSNEKKQSVEAYLKNEIEALKTAKDLLSFGEDSSLRNKSVSLSSQIDSILEPRDYLYLHFPDGTSYRNDTGFLKRIRAELDFFIKIQATALNISYLLFP